MNTFKFNHMASKSGCNIPDLFSDLLLPSAFAIPSSYRVSPDKAKLRITGISFQPVEQSADTSAESAFNMAQLCEIDYDKANPNQTVTCTVELQVGLHYKTIDFKVAPNVDVYIDDSANGIFSTAAGLVTSSVGATLDYFTVSYNNNNTSFHADFPFPINTAGLNTTLSEIKTIDGCSNTVEIKMVLSSGTVLSDTTYTPGAPCGTSGTTQSTINIGTQNLNVIVDMIHGIQVDRWRGAPPSIRFTVPWWTIAGTIGTGLSVKHFASQASTITSATYAFPPSGGTGVSELKVAYANGVAVAAQMVPNGFNTTTFCHDDYDTPGQFARQRLRRIGQHRGGVGRRPVAQRKDDQLHERVFYEHGHGMYFIAIRSPRILTPIRARRSTPSVRKCQTRAVGASQLMNRIDN